MSDYSEWKGENSRSVKDVRESTKSFTRLLPTDVHDHTILTTFGLVSVEQLTTRHLRVSARLICRDNDLVRLMRRPT